MTTTIKITSHNYPALVRECDLSEYEVQGEKMKFWKTVNERVLTPADGEQQFYCTTTRRIEVYDIEYDDERATPPVDEKTVEH
jgi:hypothetical protein